MSNRFYAGASAGERFAGYANLAMNLYQLKQNADQTDLKEKELAMRERFGNQEREEQARVNNMRYGKGGLEDQKIENARNQNTINERKAGIDEAKLPQSKQNFSRSVVAMEVAKMKSAGLDKAYKPTIDYLTELADDPSVTKGEAYLRIKTSYPHFRKVMIDNLQKELVSGTESNPDFMNTPRGQNILGEIEALDQDPEGKYIDQLFPDVVEERAMEERKMKLEEQKAQKEPKDIKLYNTVEGYLPADKAIGKLAPRNGMKLTTPDGTVLETGVTTGADNGLQKKTTTDIEKDLYDSSKRYARVIEIKKTFDPKYQEWATRIGNKWSAMKSSAGVGLTGKETKDLEGYTKFRQNSFENINLYIKEITGAQMSEAEAGRLTKAMPTPGQGLFDGDSPPEFKAKMENVIKNLTLIQARSSYWRRNGFDQPIDSMPIEKMPQIMKGWAAAREADLIGQGMPKKQAEQMVVKEMPQYFGIAGN